MTYIIEANVGLVFFYGIYFLLLRNETDFRKQRFFLLTASVCALVFPLVDIDLVSTAPVLGSGIAGTTMFLPDLLVGENETGSIRTADVVLAIYVLVAITMAVPLVVQGMRMYRIVRSTAGSYYNNFYVIESTNDNPSWSFFRFIFIGQSDNLSSHEKELIVKHEMLHGKLFHSIDTLLLSAVCLVFWFNPIVWVYRKTMARIHEFEVDTIVSAESNRSDYGILLAKTALSSNGFLLTHHFNQSFILKRIDMLNKIKSRISSWKLTVLATTIVIYFVAVSCTEEVSDPNPEVYAVVDDTATPKNGFTAFYEQLADKLVYPEEARRTGVEGKVFVEFVVMEDGHLADFKVVKGIGAGCDIEAVKALTQMDNWKPAIMQGKAVRQKLVLPLTFKLN